jgi:gliding motility-associated-like protein
VIKKRISYKSFLLRAAFLLHVCCLLSGKAHAREGVDTFGVTIFSNATIYAHDKSKVGILSDVINNGIFGSVPGSIINMAGSKWTNTNGSSLPDELGVNSFSGIGGTFRFISNNTPQSFIPNFTLAGKTGASFPNLTIANPFGVTIENSDAHVRNTLHFENGIVWLNGNNLLIGTNGPGTITGFSDKNFVATGNTIKGGYLYRAKIAGASGNILFPIGPQAGSYSPLSIMFNATAPQDIHVRAFDDVYRNAFIGAKGDPLSVQQTWNIGQEDNTPVASIVALQHNETREGPAFTAHRADSYIALYDFTARAYDTLPPSGISSGTFTSGPALSNAYINLRALNSLGQSSYLAKKSHLTADSLTLGKGALQPVRQPDGSFIVTYQFFVRNDGLYRADSLQILDSLDKVFKSSMSFTIGSVTATGNLKANNGFDGVTNTDLLLNTSTLAANVTDTVTLVLNVRITSKEEYFYNTAIVRGVLNGYNNSQYLFSNGSVNGFKPPLPGAQPVPTPIVLTEAKYVMPHGFSPNGDGINDFFIIGNLGTSSAALWIFDKKGVYVYKNMNYKNDWDGTNNQNVGGGLSNQKIADGTYFYKAVITDNATGKQETYNGFISVWK